MDETMSLTVDDVFIYNGEIEIPEGKVVLLMDTSGVSEYYDFLSRLHAGQTLTVANQAVGDDGTWKTAENAVSSVGGRLVTNGVANSDFEAGAAPRTAVGIKADGNIIFYTLDGRQSGYSYGAQLKTLAKRMVELGCVDALILTAAVDNHFCVVSGKRQYNGCKFTVGRLFEKCCKLYFLKGQSRENEYSVDNQYYRRN